MGKSPINVNIIGNIILIIIWLTWMCLKSVYTPQLMAVFRGKCGFEPKFGCTLLSDNPNVWHLLRYAKMHHFFLPSSFQVAVEESTWLSYLQAGAWNISRTSSTITDQKPWFVADCEARQAQQATGAQSGTSSIQFFFEGQVLQIPGVSGVFIEIFIGMLMMFISFRDRFWDYSSINDVTHMSLSIRLCASILMHLHVHVLK